MATIHVRVGPRPLSIAQAYARLKDAASGGVVLFLGRVRPDRSGGRVLRSLLYEAHVPLAERELRRIAAESSKRFRATIVVVWHRIGLVRVGEPSVIVGAAAPHRDQAFRAARLVIDRLKRTAPIWKSASLKRGPRRPR
ncbi:MAG TPA: molybdenum cofactor biosynthesis protein MoaE [Thermoplasmata archaeon]|nr:molybdenum cofactor biosynthesis protein MoaE [Thermoplasmata archaeon]